MNPFVHSFESSLNTWYVPITAIEHLTKQDETPIPPEISSMSPPHLAQPQALMP